MEDKPQEINITAEIRAELARQKHSVAWLAKQIGYDPSNLNKYLKRDGHLYSIELLLKISICLKVDFFEKYSQYINSLTK
jgi:lambda repressor-like predicted transcriptional regulator